MLLIKVVSSSRPLLSSRQNWEFSSWYNRHSWLGVKKQVPSFPADQYFTSRESRARPPLSLSLSLQSPWPGHLCPLRVQGQITFVLSESKARPPLSLQSPGPGHLCPFRVQGQATFVPSESRAPLSLQSPGPGHLSASPLSLLRPVVNILSLTNVSHGTVVNSISLCSDLNFYAKKPDLNFWWKNFVPFFDGKKPKHSEHEVMGANTTSKHFDFNIPSTEQHHVKTSKKNNYSLFT